MESSSSSSQVRLSGRKDDVAVTRYRSRITILERILTAVRDHQPATWTRIMYVAYLSYGQVKYYLELAKRSQLVHTAEHGSSVYYVLTPKGLEVLYMIARLDRLIPEFLVGDGSRRAPFREQPRTKEQDEEAGLTRSMVSS